MKLLTKDEIIGTCRKIFAQGWHKSVKKTKNMRNDGAVGNTLEVLLGIKENNLPIPNANDWELKGQRLYSGSLITLKHIEPSPQGVKIVSNLLLSHYGWKHKEAGKKYPTTEMSFRSTTSATNFTNRGFQIVADRQQKKLRFIFDAAKVDKTAPKIHAWHELIAKRMGLGPLNPEPYWGFQDLEHTIGAKIKNCFYVIAENKTENQHEFFLYKSLHVLSGFSFDKFLKCIEDGVVLIDFDARTGHNHGTKFRIKQDHWTDLYSEVKQAI